MELNAGSFIFHQIMYMMAKPVFLIMKIHRQIRSLLMAGQSWLVKSMPCSTRVQWL